MIITLNNYQTSSVGSKARSLFRLLKHGCAVPPFFCVTENFEETEVQAYLAGHFPDTRLFSVRSCASAEDSASCSFAGQFRTFLNVERTSVCARIRQVFESACTPSVLEYCRLRQIDPASIRLHVMVQEMVEADTSGVLFTANPQGILNESVIILGRGTGDRIVEDRADVTCYYYNLTDRTCCCEQTGDSPLLAGTQLQELIRISRKLRKLFAMECDLEYAWKDGRLFLLQVRPITTLDENAPVIVLDNSNIAESYPGITLPLTRSFIQDAYHQVFYTLLLRLTGEEDTVRRMDPVLRHMVDMANGRVYYRISNWYDVLLLLPFHKKLIPVWQEMMGVGNRTISSGQTQKIRTRTRLKTTLSFFRLLLTCPREMERLEIYFTEILEQFQTVDTGTGENRKLLEAYHALLDRTAARWDITLVNDMYAFLFTGLLKACLKAERVRDPDLTASRAIRGIARLDSMEPLRELEQIAAQAVKEGRLDELQALQSNEDCNAWLQRREDSLAKRIREHIRRFGDRNTEELKLESRTFRTDPILLIRLILQYAQAPGQTAPQAPSGPAGPPRLSPLSRFLAERAALGIRNRERSRLHRSRLYGMMRTLVLQIGRNLKEEGRIRTQEDVFWLYCEELEQAAADPDLELQERIRTRREQYDGFRSLPPYSRLVFSGKVTDKHPRNIQKNTITNRQDVYTGIPCSPGTATGRVLIIEDPSRPADTAGRILVTRMTDPGWVYLIAHAKAIVAEKGSLLSHTAIIARELSRPAVVGISHITELLRDGDLVRVDGNTGTVTVLSGPDACP